MKNHSGKNKADNIKHSQHLRALAHLPNIYRCFIFGISLLGMAGCNVSDRLSEIGQAPRLAAVNDPSSLTGATQVSMPMPPPPSGDRAPNSLWQPGARTFFRDQRAGRVGDILTVVIDLDEEAKLDNETKRSRANSDKMGAPNIYGFETRLKSVLPDAVDPSKLIGTSSTLDNTGKGSIGRSEKIKLRVAATITQILPNGNLVIAGQQQVVVNFELRELKVSGVIRPEDISSENTIKSDQIAEARISYGGRGQIQDVQQPRYGSQILDIIMPF